MSVLLFFGGINYENNLILGLCFLMVSLFLVAILHTFRNLSGLSLRAGASRSGFVGGQGSVEVVLIAQRRPHRALRLRWLDQPAQEISVEPGEESALWPNLPLNRRGRTRPPRLRVKAATRWGCCAAGRWCRWIRFARPGRARRKATIVPPTAAHRERQVASAGQSGSEEFQGLRGYVPGDSLAQVDWKGYARGRGLNVKLFEEPASGRLWLRYDRLEGAPVERRLSILCFWVQRLSRENRPFAPGAARRRAAAGAGRGTAAAGPQPAGPPRRHGGALMARIYQIPSHARGWLTLAIIAASLPQLWGGPLRAGGAARRGAGLACPDGPPAAGAARGASCGWCCWWPPWPPLSTASAVCTGRRRAPR